MPKSKPSLRRRAAKASRQRRRPGRYSGVESEEPSSSRKGTLWQKRIGWGIAIVGGVLFLITNVGARTGLVALPFDPHHVLGQVGGAILIIIGILLGSSA